MAKYELSLSKDYVPDWTITDAVRELFQNALDQQTTTTDNEMFFSYDEKTKTLEIGNKKSVLSTSSLLLGSSSKRGQDETIGQFGEGYKIATLVLTRLGKKVTFYNYGAKEVWSPRFVKSRRYGTDILTFFVDKKYVWNSVPDRNLTIIVEGVEIDEMTEIYESNLHLIPPTRFLETQFGRIILDEDKVGKVYVNGLFICKHEPYRCGYDFKPSEIKLDRDRKLVSDFNLTWLASKMWGSCTSQPDLTEEEKKQRLEIASDLATTGAADVKYLTESSGMNSTLTALADVAYLKFIEEYGTNAYPVFNNDDMVGILPSYKSVIVSEAYANLLRKSKHYIPARRREIPSLKERVEYWIEQWEDKITPHGAIEELKLILEDE